MIDINNELLSKYIDQTGLSYSELAETIKVSRGTIYNVIVGDTHPSLSVINILGNSLEFTQDDFLATFFPTIQFKKEFSYDEPTC